MKISIGLLLIISLLSASCQDEDANRGWRKADFEASVNGEIVYDIFYDTKIEKMFDFVVIRTSIVFTDYGKKIYYNSKQPESKQMISSGADLLVDFKTNRLTPILIINYYEDGSSDVTRFKRDELEWFTPPKGSTSECYMNLAIRLAKK